MSLARISHQRSSRNDASALMARHTTEGSAGVPEAVRRGSPTEHNAASETLASLQQKADEKFGLANHVKWYCCFLMLVGIHGCSIINSPERQLRKSIQEFVDNINKHAWQKADLQISKDFDWFDKNDQRYFDKENKSSGHRFITSIKSIVGRNTIQFKILKTVTVSKTLVQGYLQIIVIAEGQKHLQWRTRLDWRQEGNQWKLVAAKDITSIKNRQNKSMMGDLNDFVDYATGVTPTRALKKARKKVHDIQEKHNQDLMDALE